MTIKYNKLKLSSDKNINTHIYVYLINNNIVCILENEKNDYEQNIINIRKIAILPKIISNNNMENKQNILINHINHQNLNVNHYL